jgi:pyridoxal 5'-phosphate synthase pdxS subunit
MLKGGVIMDVVNAEQAVIAERAGAWPSWRSNACLPTSAKKAAWPACRPSPESSARLWPSVTIPVMAKARIGHFTEARILEALGVDYIDESEVLTPADEEHHIDKRDSKSRSSAARAIWAKRCGASPKARP